MLRLNLGRLSSSSNKRLVVAAGLGEPGKTGRHHLPPCLRNSLLLSAPRFDGLSRELTRVPMRRSAGSCHASVCRDVGRFTEDRSYSRGHRRFRRGPSRVRRGRANVNSPTSVARSLAPAMWARAGRCGREPVDTGSSRSIHARYLWFGYEPVESNRVAGTRWRGCFRGASRPSPCCRQQDRARAPSHQAAGEPRMGWHAGNLGRGVYWGIGRMSLAPGYWPFEQR